MRIRAKNRLTREGWYYLFVLAFVLGGAILRDINLLLVFGGMLLGPLVMSWWMAWRSLAALQIERQLPPHVSAGDLVVVGLTLTNTARRGGARFVTVEDTLRRIAPGGAEIVVPAQAKFAEVPAGESRRMTYRGPLPRGRYRLGPLRLRTRFPLGLLERTLEIEVFDELVVAPQLGRLVGRGQKVRQETWLGNRRAHHRHGSLEADFYGLRDWRAGDSRRWIHWRTSARRGGLMVRQFEQPRHEDLTLLLELWQPEMPDAPHLDHVELALSYAATVLAEACRWGNCKLFLGIAGKELEVRHGAASRPMLQEALEALAVAEPSSTPGTELLVAQAVRQMRSGGAVLVIGTRAVELSKETFAALPKSRVAMVNVDSREFSEVYASAPVEAAAAVKQEAEVSVS